VYFYSWSIVTNNSKCNEGEFRAREIAFICEVPHEVLVNVQKNILALVGEGYHYHLTLIF